MITSRPQSDMALRRSLHPSSLLPEGGIPMETPSHVTRPLLERHGGGGSLHSILSVARMTDFF